MILFTPETGRTHQIRDPRLGRDRHADCRRSGLRARQGPMLLHALSLRVDRGDKPPIEATAPLPPSFVSAGFGDIDPGNGRCRLSFPEDALEEKFLAASGPGGQNVNKVATAVPAALRRLRARAGAGRLSPAQDAGRQPDERGRRDRHHRPQIPHPGGQSRGRAGAAGGADRRRPMSGSRSGGRPGPSRAAKAKRVDSKKQRGSVKQAARKGDSFGLDVRFRIEAADKPALYRDWSGPPTR